MRVTAIRTTSLGSALSSAASESTCERVATSEAVTPRLCPARHPRSWNHANLPPFLHESLSSGRLRSFKPPAQRKQGFYKNPFYVKGKVSASPVLGASKT